MLKKLLLSALFLTISIFHVSAQNCQPDPAFNESGISPDSATNFVTGYAGQPYMQVMTVVVPKDTQLFPFPLPATPFDSIVMSGLTGLPNGFTYSCSPARCVWKGNSKGCISIIGNPTTNEVGMYPLLFTGKAYVGGSTSFSQPITINYYKVTILPANGIAEQENIKLNVTQNDPNPFGEKTRIGFNVNEPGLVTLQVFNILGKQVFSESIKAVQGANVLDFDRKDLSSGLYIYSLRYKNLTVSKKMIIR